MSRLIQTNKNIQPVAVKIGFVLLFSGLFAYCTCMPPLFLMARLKSAYKSLNKQKLKQGIWIIKNLLNTNILKSSKGPVIGSCQIDLKR